MKRGHADPRCTASECWCGSPARGQRRRYSYAERLKWLEAYLIMLRDRVESYDKAILEVQKSAKRCETMITELLERASDG